MSNNLSLANLEKILSGWENLVPRKEVYFGISIMNFFGKTL